MSWKVKKPAPTGDLVEEMIKTTRMLRDGIDLGHMAGTIAGMTDARRQECSQAIERSTRVSTIRFIPWGGRP